MTGVALLLAVAALAYALAHALDLPSIPVLMLGGLLASELLRPEQLDTALILGVTFLLFVAAVELGPARLGEHRRRALRVGLIQFVALGVAGLGAALLLGFDALSAAFIALALTASSTLVVVRLLRRRRQMYEPFARTVVGVLLLQDILVIALIPVVTRAPRGTTAVLAGVLGVAALVAMAAATTRWIAPVITRLGREEETLLLAVLAVLFVFLGASDLLGLPLLVGAFLAGVTLAGFPSSAIVRPVLTSVGDFFTAIFFTALGAIIGIPTLTQVGHALILAALVVIGTPPLVTWIAERSGLSARSAIEAGLLLAQTSELSLVIGLYALLQGQIDQGVFGIIALVTFITMLLTPFITTDTVAWALMRLHPVRRAGPQIRPPSDGHVLVLGCGTTGLPLVETLFSSGYEVVVIDDDPTIVAQLRDAEIPVIRGEATDPAVLAQARASQARIITSTIRRAEDNRRLLEQVSDVPILVRVFEESDAEWVRELGGTPVLYSEAAAAGLMEWWEKQLAGAESQRSPGSKR